MSVEIVGAPWLEHGAGCVQIRVPQGAASKPEGQGQGEGVPGVASGTSSPLAAVDILQAKA